MAKQCKITLMEAQSIIDIVCKQFAREPRCLAGTEAEGDEMFTTGDKELDDALGGGIRTGMVWEVVGQRYDLDNNISLAVEVLTVTSALPERHN
jgi:DNA repair protein RAD57